MSTTKLYYLFFLVTIIILSSAILTAQVKIKERVELSSTNTVNPPIIRYSELSGITLPPIEAEVTALSSNGGFLGGGYDCEDPDADLPFTSRIGGNLRIALFQCGGCVDADIYNETLLIFGPDGNIRHIFPMALFDSCMAPGADGDFHIYEGCFNSWYNVSGSSGGCLNYFNPFIFFQSAYEQALERDGWANAADFTHPPDRLNVPIKPWEPLRFRLFSEKNGLLYKCVNCFYHAVVMGPDSIVYAGSLTQLPEVLVFRSGDYDVYSHYDPATVFPLNFVRDSSVTGSAPSSIESPYPAFVTDSGMYRIIMAAAKPNTHGALTMTSPVSQVIFPDIQSAMGDTVLVGPFSEGTQIQLELSGCRTYIREMNYGQFRFQYENWTDYDFGDAIVDVQYATGRPDHLELWSNTETIYYGDTIDVDVVPCDKDSLFSPLGPDCYYEFSVILSEETSKYVELIYDGVGSNIVEYIPSENRRGLGVRLAANKLEPDSVVDLTFHLTASEFGEIGAASVIPTTTQPTRMAKLSKDIHIKMKSGDTSIKNIVDQKISEPIVSKKEFGQKKEDRLNSKPVVYHKKKIGHLISRQGSSSTNQARKLIQVKDASTNEIRYSIADGAAWNVIMENEWGIGINPPQDILLGETIYFQAIEDPIQTTEHKKILLIIPLEKISDRHEPRLSGVRFMVEKLHGDNLGVYYDDKLDENGSSSLTPDIIRLVGRYWNGDANKYTVRLTATTSDRNGHMLIEVKKPIKLGDTYTYSRSVHDNPIGDPQLNIDEECIKYGGEYGIPPQFVKAQIFSEASKNLDGVTGKGFAPTYVYEPYTTQNLSGWLDDPRYNKGMWLVDKTRPQTQWMGTGKSVPTHLNVQDYSYPTEPQTVWDMIVEHSQLVNATSGFSHTKYGLRKGNGEMNFYQDSYGDIADAYNDQLKAALYSCYFYGAPPGQTYADVSRAYMARYLRDEWQPNGITTKGAVNMTAQTRVASSYGFLQFLFSTAVEKRNYPNYNPNMSPEDLNETDINLRCGMEYQKQLLINRLGKAIEKDGNWPDGLEGTFIKAVWKEWNTRALYPSEVANKIKDFKPQ